jgi:hypothetical protein
MRPTVPAPSAARTISLRAGDGPTARKKIGWRSPHYRKAMSSACLVEIGSHERGALDRIPAGHADV